MWKKQATEKEFMEGIGHGVSPIDNSHSHCPTKNSPCGNEGEHRCCLCLKPIKNNWKEDFDNYFLEKIGKDDGYTEERRIAKDFIESLFTESVSEAYTLSQEPSGEVVFNGIVYIPKSLLAEQKKELMDKSLEEIGSWDYDMIANSTPYQLYKKYIESFKHHDYGLKRKYERS